MTEVATYDPFDPRVVVDPYPHYARLHEGDRVVRDERWDIWILHRYDDVSAALRDHGRLSSAEGVTYMRAPLPMMLTLDPPDHERLRRIAGRDFAPRGIDRFRPRIEHYVRDGLDELAATEVGDVVEALAIPVPIRVMASILGIGDADIPALRRMADDLVNGFAITPSSLGLPEYDLTRIGRAILEIHAFFDACIADRKRHPTDDLLTELLRPADEGTLTREELSWFCLLLLVAGIETTTNLISNLFIAFAHHPDQWELVRDRPELAGAATREALRFDPPVQSFFRTVKGSYEVGDVTIPDRARVMVSFGAANHDPRKYADPTMFRVERDPTDHLAFGGGIHRCLGAGLAELEGRIVVEELARRAGSIEIAGDVVRTTSPTLRGATALPVRLATKIQA